MKISFLLLLALFYFLYWVVNCSPLKKHSHDKKTYVHNNNKKTFKEFEYDVTLESSPNQVSYYVNPDELPKYEEELETIRTLGAEIECKLAGDCQSERREEIQQQKPQDVPGSKKSMESMFGNGMPGNDQLASPQNAMNSIGSPGELSQNFNNDQRYSQQHNAAQYGQQPQMDLKMSPQEEDAIQPGPPGMNNQPGNMGPSTGGFPSPGGEQVASNPMERMQNQANDEIIQNSIQSKLSFMDQANQPRVQSMGPGIQNSIQSKLAFMDQANQPRVPSMVPGIQNPIQSKLAFMDQANQPRVPSMGPGNAGAESVMATHDGTLRDGDSGPHGMPNTDATVSENDIMNAESIQPNEMHDLHNFLQNSNQVNLHGGRDDAEMSDGKFVSNEDYVPSENNQNDHSQLSKTGIDFGAAHAQIENREENVGRSNDNEKVPGPRPGTPEVPTLNNLLGGTPNDDGEGPPSLQFIEKNTRDMMQTNSDYSVPSSAFSNLWKNFLSTTQSQLGQQDPSANSREEIDRPLLSKHKELLNKGNDHAVRRWKKSDGTRRYLH